MGQRRKESRWAIPRQTRHVWVRGKMTPPQQGLVLEWRRQSWVWSALVLVSSADDDGRPIAAQVWVPANQLIPVHSDPNDGGRVRHFV